MIQLEANRRVVITGLGCVTPIGSTVEAFQAALYSGITGIRPLPPYPEAPGPSLGLKFSQAATVPDFDPAQHLSSGVALRQTVLPSLPS